MSTCHCSRFSRVLVAMECQASLMNCHRTDIQESLRHVIPPELQVVPITTRTVPLGPVGKVPTENELRLLVNRYSEHPVTLLNFQLDKPTGTIHCHVSHMNSLHCITVASITGKIEDIADIQQKLSPLSFNIPVTQRSLLLTIVSIPATFWFHENWMRFCDKDRTEYASFIAARPQLFQNPAPVAPALNQEQQPRPSVPAPQATNRAQPTGAPGHQHPGQPNLLFTQPRPQTSHPFSTPVSRNVDGPRQVRLDYGQAAPAIQATQSAQTDQVDPREDSSDQQLLPRSSVGSRESQQAANLDILSDWDILVNPILFKHDILKQLDSKTVSPKYHTLLMLLIHGLAEFVPEDELTENDTKQLLFYRKTPDEAADEKNTESNSLDKE